MTLLGVSCHHLDIGYDTVGSTLCVEAKESIKGMYRAEIPYPTVPAMFLSLVTRVLCLCCRSFCLGHKTILLV